MTFAEDVVAAESRDQTPHPDGMAAAIRRWPDLDSDIARIEGELAADPLIRPLVERRPASGSSATPDECEAVIATVAGQQASLAAARTCKARRVAADGRTAAGLRALPAP
ncbi:AlkA N-terminal domain-containing protein [Sinosporangium siamense]|uniref:DNA-3-methyladenine glycosylase AlkA N-terminal domain-containing protein n=1 Tax=Sinosporangium siamense TaxID=1367973 RepID=A0A919RK08_9ACTN|nr:AlkA N-terminal domain-containing protein [Sinosporangium siamense]GII94250.1 hypothetical protein Ssi02_44810 [Sinosporangium siamense]